MIDIRRAGERFRTEEPGITTWHSFSSGPHYDPHNLSFGPVVACDEHLVDPGAGFARHPHARVELISWVLGGTLLHEGSAGRARMIAPPQAQYQLAGTGIEHVERNPSSIEPLHFVQLWLLSDEDVPDYDVAEPPLRLCDGKFSVLRRCRDERLHAPLLHLYVARGNFHLAGQDLAAGDSVRAANETLELDGDGELLVVATVDV
ncbi:MAG TPA: pirin family protein [Jatrophihabitans sp.]|nr:pirin family protein [Jatrophihabitans sp.]